MPSLAVCEMCIFKKNIKMLRSWGCSILKQNYEVCLLPSYFNSYFAALVWLVTDECYVHNK